MTKINYRPLVDGRWRTEMQVELSEFYGDDIMQWIEFHRSQYGWSWHTVSAQICKDTGYRLSPHTYARWMAYERNGR